MSLELLEEVDVTNEDVKIIIKFMAAIDVIYKRAKINSLQLENNEFNNMSSYAEKIKFLWFIFNIILIWLSKRK